jgi:predicted MFS family arabinose efflux permease
MARGHSERTIVLLVAAVQFVNILDFVMVMPMGPQFAAALGIPISQLGSIGGSYTAAAAVSGLACAAFIDRFDRRKALAVAMLGLVCGTALGGLARGMSSLMLARVVAGMFGGPATSLSFSIIADVVPPERRGKATGVVMGSFSVAQVLGVYSGLLLAENFGWRAPFFAVAGLGALVAAGAIFLLPALTGHLKAVRAGTAGLADLIKKPLVLVSWATTSVVMVAGFVLIPNLAGYLQVNLGYPFARLKWLYAAGGLASLLSTQVSGRLVDRIGSFRTGTLGALLVVAVVYGGFAVLPPLFPVLALFIGFMFAMGMRNVAYNALATKVPLPGERARFMSIQSAVQHFSSAGGAFLGSRLLGQAADQSLVGMPRVAMVSIALSLVIPLLLWLVEGGVLRRDRGAVALAAAGSAPRGEVG